MKICKLLLLSFLVLLSSESYSFAVNLYDGAKPPDGLYFLSNSSYYKTPDNRAVTETLRLTYYNSLFVGTALLPAGGYIVNNTDNNKSSAMGVGDLTLGVGSFLPINIDNQYNKIFNVLPMLFVQFPMKGISSGNYSSNQFGISPQIYFNKITDTDVYALDIAAKYSYHFEDIDTKVKPGSELSVESVIGFNILDRMKLGPTVTWVQREKTEIDGVTIANTDDNVVSVGLDFLIAVKCVNMEFSYMRDVYSEHLRKGDYYQVRMIFNIWDK